MRIWLRVLKILWEVIRMTIKEIYEKFDKIGCTTFSTIHDRRVESRIAHFFAWDEDGTQCV